MSRLRFMLPVALIFGATGFLRASAGEEGAAFLDIPVGAAPAALGSAYTALAADAYAPVWNPAGLGFLESAELAGQHLSYLESVHDEFASVVLPLPARQGVGLSVQYLGTGNIDSTLAGGIPNGTFSSHYAAYSAAYGKAVSDRLSVGVTGKWIEAAIANFSANAYAADLGALYRMNERVSLAAVLANTGTKLKFIDDGDSLPLALRMGAAWKVTPRWQISGEGVYEKNGPASVHVGTEWRPLSIMALRAGYETDTLRGLSALAGVTAGIGLTLAGQELAYAWRTLDDLGNTHYFSLVIRFGEKTRERKNFVRQEQTKRPRAEDSGESLEADDPQFVQLMENEAKNSVSTAPEKFGAAQ